MKVGQRNRNLEKVRSMDKDHIRETKAVLRRILATNSNLGRALAGQSRAIDKERFGQIARELGFSLDPDQLEVIMYYIDPSHQGTVTVDKISSAIQHPTRLDDSVSRDLESRRSPLSASTHLSESSAGTGLRVERLKAELRRRCVGGKIQEEDFRDAVRSQMPHLGAGEIDRMVDDALSHKETGRKRADNIITDIYKRAAANPLSHETRARPSRDFSASNFTLDSRTQSGKTAALSPSESPALQRDPKSPVLSSEDEPLKYLRVTRARKFDQAGEQRAGGPPQREILLYPEEDRVELSMLRPAALGFPASPQKPLGNYEVQDALLRLSQKTNVRAKSALETFQLFKKNDTGYELLTQTGASRRLRPETEGPGSLLSGERRQGFRLSQEKPRELLRLQFLSQGIQVLDAAGPVQILRTGPVRGPRPAGCFFERPAETAVSVGPRTSRESACGQESATQQLFRESPARATQRHREHARRQVEQGRAAPVRCPNQIQAGSRRACSPFSQSALGLQELRPGPREEVAAVSRAKQNKYLKSR